jgi:hypothetical protein
VGRVRRSWGEAVYNAAFRRNEALSSKPLAGSYAILCSGTATIEKLTIVVDAGTVVDPDGALAQIEGGALWGLSMALHEGTEFVKGQVKDTNLDSYTPLRMGDEPELDIEFIDSTEVPVGLSVRFASSWSGGSAGTLEYRPRAPSTRYRTGSAPGDRQGVGGASPLR